MEVGYTSYKDGYACVLESYLNAECNARFLKSMNDRLQEENEALRQQLQAFEAGAREA